MDRIPPKVRRSNCLTDAVAGAVCGVLRCEAPASEGGRNKDGETNQR